MKNTYKIEFTKVFIYKEDAFNLWTSDSSGILLPSWRRVRSRLPPTGFIYPSRPQSALKAMEEELGSVLVYRRGKRLEITESGKALYKYALQMTQLMEEAKAEVIEVGNGDKGTLSLGINTLSSVELPSWRMSSRQDIPKSRIKFSRTSRISSVSS